MRLRLILIAATLLLPLLGCSAPEPQAGTTARQLRSPDPPGVVVGPGGQASLVGGALGGTQPTTPMIWNLKAPTATALQSGEVLTVEKNRAELYDGATDTWSAAAPPLVARTYPTATLLPDGKVLLAGGYNGSGSSLADAELYDPVTNTWSATAPMSVARFNHTATLLLSGKVLIVGGYKNAGLYSTELYDPVTQTWSLGPTMGMFHFDHTATLLSDGNVLIAGSGGVHTWNTVELFDAKASAWSFVGPMHIGRQDHTATLLPDGRVLVAGGYDPNGSLVSFSSAEIYSPATQTWAWTGAMSGDRTSHTATLLPSGKVLVTGGEHVSTAPFHSFAIKLSTTELFDPTTGTWTSGPSMKTERTQATATSLPSGRVLIAGGGACPSAELFTSTGAGCALPEECPSGFCADGVCCDAACAAGACDACSVAAGATANGTCTSLTGPVCDDGSACTQGDTCQAGACLGAAVADGAVCDGPCLPAGTCAGGSCVGASAPDGTGCNDGNACTSSDVCQAGACVPGAGILCSTADTCHDAGSCDPATGLCSSPVKPNGSSCSAGTCQVGACVGGVSWTPTGGVGAPPLESTATLLLDGRVLSFGGYHGSPLWGGFIAPALYDPKTDSWSQAGPVSPPRVNHTATRLADGKVFISSGSWADGSSTPPPPDVIYDPGANTWTDIDPGPGFFLKNTTVLLPSGKVFGLGDYHSAWIYDPAVNLWTPTAGSVFVHAPTDSASTTLLPSGKVLVAGRLDATEIYDPATDTWSATAFSSSTASHHTAVLLSNGKVLFMSPDYYGALPFSQIYDPTANTWTTAAPMRALRNDFDAVVLDDGTVLVAGLAAVTPCVGSRQTERYDPQIDAWIPSLPTIAEGYQRLTKLADGRVLATSAETSAPTSSPYTSSAELFDGPPKGGTTSSSSGAGGGGAGGGVPSSTVGAGGGSASSSASSGVGGGGGSSSASSGVGGGGGSSSASSGVGSSSASSGVGSSSASSGVGVGGGSSSTASAGSSSASTGGASGGGASNSGCGMTGLPAPRGVWLGLGVFALRRLRRRQA